MTPDKLAEKLIAWTREGVLAAGCNGIVIGMSGGIDSSVLAILCHRAFPQNMIGVLMPCFSQPLDEKHARIVASKFSIPTKLVILDEAFNALLKVLPADIAYPERNRLAESNIKARLRMTALYYIANQLNYMVAGAGNKSELSVGYFTKYGDSGVDILPLGNLMKREVRELARFLDIPAQIIDKSPSAGLWPGQTDEDEMGFSYEQLDHYLDTGDISVDIRKKLESVIAANAHKRLPPPLADF